MTWEEELVAFMLVLCGLALLAGLGGLVAIAVYGVTVRLRGWWRPLLAEVKASSYCGRHAAARGRGGRLARWWRGDCGSAARLWEEALQTGREPYISVIASQWRLAVWHPYHGEVLDRDRYVSEADARAALVGLGRSQRGVMP